MLELLDAANMASPQRGEELQAQADIANVNLNAARDAHEATKAAEQTARRIAGAASARLKQLQEEAAETERIALETGVSDDGEFADHSKRHLVLSHRVMLLKKAIGSFRVLNLRDAERATLVARMEEIHAEYEALGLRHDFLLNQMLCDMKVTALR